MTGYALLVLAGLVAGVIDSIAGGGGLITLPSIALAVGPGVDAIGSNKIAGTLAAAVALAVYHRDGHMDWRRGVLFSAFVGAGSFLGSKVSPLIPPSAFRWLLLGTCPTILWIVWRRQWWVEHPPRPETGESSRARAAIVAVCGLACGFYDGVWGPGGGTFMFLSLLFFARLPLLTSLAASKLANTSSAFVALLSYAASGHVHWLPGACVGAGICGGAFFGARHATRSSARAVRPALAVVAALLLIKLFIDWYSG